MAAAAAAGSTCGGGRLTRTVAPDVLPPPPPPPPPAAGGATAGRRGAVPTTQSSAAAEAANPACGRRVRRRLGSAVDAGTDAHADPPPLLQLLAANLVTAGAVCGLIDTADATALRRVHSLVRDAVREVPWCDTVTPVLDAARWRAVFPVARGAFCEMPLVVGGGPLALLMTVRASGALAGLTDLQVSCNRYVKWTGGGILDLTCLPPTLARLSTRNSSGRGTSADFSHLPALVSLDCFATNADDDDVATLPPCLTELVAGDCLGISRKIRFAHLPALRVLDCSNTLISNAAVAIMPPSLVTLDISRCRMLHAGLTLAHLPALRALKACGTLSLDDRTVASLPATVVDLGVAQWERLTTAVSFSHLSALRTLDCRGTDVGPASVASLPPSLVELQLNSCRNVTAAANIGHLRALRWLDNVDVSRCTGDVLAAWRARTRKLPQLAVLRARKNVARALALLPDGRLAYAEEDGAVQLWDSTARGREAVTPLEGNHPGVTALLALPDGRHLAAGIRRSIGHLRSIGSVILWRATSSSRAVCANVACASGVAALAALPDGQLAVGCADGCVRVVNVATRAVVATLEGHEDHVDALAVLPDGRLACGSSEDYVRVWDVERRACVAVLSGHTDWVHTLAVLPDGRLASGSDDGSVRLWEVGAHAGICTAVLVKHAGEVRQLAALPDGRLVYGAGQSFWLWDVRTPASPGARNVWEPLTITETDADGFVHALVAVPGGRLVSVSSHGTLRLWQVPQEW